MQNNNTEPMSCYAKSFDCVVVPDTQARLARRKKTFARYARTLSAALGESFSDQDDVPRQNFRWEATPTSSQKKDAVPSCTCSKSRQESPQQECPLHESRPKLSRWDSITKSQQLALGVPERCSSPSSQTSTDQPREIRQGGPPKMPRRLKSSDELNTLRPPKSPCARAG